MSILEMSTQGEYVCYNVGKVELQESDFEKIEKVLRTCSMTISEFCAYAMAMVAETHVNADGTVTDLL